MLILIKFGLHNLLKMQQELCFVKPQQPTHLKPLFITPSKSYDTIVIIIALLCNLTLSVLSLLMPN